VLPVEIAPGLLRWTAAYPEADLEGWEAVLPGETNLVGSVLYELPDVVVLIDPLLPREHRGQFLDWLDARVGVRRVTILTTIHWHRRDREELAARYRDRSPRAWNEIPAGVEPRPLRGAGETLYWLPAPAALVAGDRLLDGADRLRLCPENWLAEVRVDRAGLAELLRPLLELPIERVLVSHGEPVLRDGRRAIESALREGPFL
jgi:hypothetical protein